ncbi:MAG: Ig-like domain-containing protein [Rubrobacteridae bacterium]|nr:Ig-like domain-containing protein [Rubrobacteridae bacterium]
MQIFKKCLALFLSVSLFLFPSYSMAAVNDWESSSVSDVRINTLAVSPYFSSDHTIFAGAQSGIIYKSVDAGQNWTQTSISSNPIQAIAIAPDYNTTSGKVYVGTSNGAYISQNSGVSWTLSTLTGVNIKCLAVSSDKRVFAGTDGNGIYSKEDSSSDWPRITSGNATLNSSTVNSIVVSPSYASDRTVFAATSSNGVCTTGTVFADSWETTDSGESWDNSPPLSAITSLAISPSFNSDHTLFAATSNNGIYKLSNNGTSWDSFNANLPSNVRDIKSIAISPSFSQDGLLFAGTNANGIYICNTIPDTTNPIITSTDPTNNSAYVSINKNITLTFSENIVMGIDAA